MPEDLQGQTEEALEPTQGEEQPVDLSATEEPTEPIEETQEAELPEDAKERTKREFEKLKAHNAELKRKLEARESIPSVLDYLEPGPVPQIPQVQVPQFVPQYQPQYAPPAPQPQLVDENGYVNADVLQQRLDAVEKATKKAEEAERRANAAQDRISRFEQDAETKQLYQAYPELDPLSDVYNEKAYRLVKNELSAQIVSSGRRDAMKAAQDMSEYFRKTPPTNKKVLEQRKQVAQPGTTQRPPSTDFEDLKLRSRFDPEALAERLERINS